MAPDFPTLLVQHLPTEIRIHRIKESLIRSEPSGEKQWFPFDLPQPLEEFRRDAAKKYLQFLLVHADGKIVEAARFAGLSRPRLYTLLQQAGISLKGKQSDAG